MEGMEGRLTQDHNTASCLRVGPFHQGCASSANSTATHLSAAELVKRISFEGNNTPPCLSLNTTEAPIPDQHRPADPRVRREHAGGGHEPDKCARQRLISAAALV